MNKKTLRDATLPAWSDPDLSADHFLYQRMGPWPQPCPSYPMQQAPEVLNIPPVETLLWESTIGKRYLQDLTIYPALAAANAVADSTQPIPSDGEFVRMMTMTVYARFLRNTNNATWVSNFCAMRLIQDVTLPGTYCCPVQCTFSRDGNGQFSCEEITFIYDGRPPVGVKPGDPAWNLAKAYALQGASYHALFVVHPALHFPMDSVNAITKSAVPHTHPLFQLLYPHTSYTLAQDNAVLEGAASVVNNNVPGTWFDPLTASGYYIKRLFGVGYSGMDTPPGVYPKFDYMKPWMDTSTPFGRCLALYFKPFHTFCTTVAAAILKAIPNDVYVERWAAYISTHVYGFPDGKQIFQPGTLAQALAIYMWDVTVSHSADHYSFANDIAPKVMGPAKTPLAAWKFLRIRHFAPPKSKNDGASVQKVGDVCDPDDLQRAEMAQQMFFKSSTIPPNLIDTGYAFTTPELLAAQGKFHKELQDVAAQAKGIMAGFMPLEAATPDAYPDTISASIQY